MNNILRHIICAITVVSIVGLVTYDVIVDMSKNSYVEVVNYSFEAEIEFDDDDFFNDHPASASFCQKAKELAVPFDEQASFLELRESAHRQLFILFCRLKIAC